MNDGANALRGVHRDVTRYSACWVLWDTAIGLALPRSIDEALTKRGFTFYSEAEYSTYDFRPPEGNSLGGWRNPDGSVFAFLLDESSRREKKFVMYVSGSRTEVSQIGKTIEQLKAQTLKVERRAIKTRDADEAILAEKKSPGTMRVGVMLGGFAAVLNVMAMLQLKFGLPSGMPQGFKDAYDYSAAVFAIASRGMLTIVAIFYSYYIVRYMYLMLRRL